MCFEVNIITYLDKSQRFGVQKKMIFITCPEGCRGSCNFFYVFSETKSGDKNLTEWFLYFMFSIDGKTHTTE